MGGQLTQRMGGSLLLLTLDPQVLAFSFGLALVVALLIAIIPAVVVNHSLAAGLCDGGRGNKGSRLTQQLGRDAAQFVGCAIDWCGLVAA